MTTGRLEAPEPVQLVPASEMITLLADTDLEFNELEARAAELTAAADHAEERAQSIGFDERGAPWAMASLQHFLEDWREDVGRDADRILHAAREGARIRVESAHAEAARLRKAREAVRVAQPRPQSPAQSAQAPAPVAPLVAFVAPSVAKAPSTAVPPTPTEVAPSAPWLAPIADRMDAPVSWSPTGDETRSDVALIPQPDAASLLVDPLIEEVPAAAATIPAPVSTIATQEANPAVAPKVDDAAKPEAEASAGEQEFWPAPTPQKRKSLLRRIPLSAVLEVIAVVLILVFILLRLS